MKSYKDIRATCTMNLARSRSEYVKAVNEYLKEHNLTKLVRRKSDGQIGVLKMDRLLNSDLGYELYFHMRRKDGVISTRKMMTNRFTELIDDFEEVKENE